MGVHLHPPGYACGVYITLKIEEKLYSLAVMHKKEQNKCDFNSVKS